MSCGQSAHLLAGRLLDSLLVDASSSPFRGRGGVASSVPGSRALSGVTTGSALRKTHTMKVGMSKSTETIVALLPTATVFLLGTPVALRLWRNESPSFNDQTALERWGNPRSARAFRRVFPLSIFAVGLTAGAWTATIIGGTTNSATIAFLLLSGICMLFAILIVLLNWPKALVPPHLRNEPGLLRDGTAE